jgi:hypothetical protein
VETKLEEEWKGSSFDDDDNFTCCGLMHFVFAGSFGKDFQGGTLENWTLNVLIFKCSIFVMNMCQEKKGFKIRSMLESSFENVIQKYEAPVKPHITLSKSSLMYHHH